MKRPTALVTGATRGLGLAIALALAPDHRLLIGGRRADDVERVVAQLPDAAAFVADLVDGSQVESAAVGVDRLDVLINCAGVVPPSEGAVRTAWQSVLETNVVAVVALTELLMPRLRASSGLVVFINSGSGLNPWGTDGYSASKYALTSYADALRIRERGEVRVSSVHPGRIDTDMQRDLQRRTGRAYDADDHMSAVSVAKLVRFVVDAPADTVLESVSIRPPVDRIG